MDELAPEHAGTHTPETRSGESPSHRSVDATELHCPEQHHLPHHTTFGDCTPLYCADAPKDRPTNGNGKLVTTSLAKADGKAIQDMAELEQRRVELAFRRAKARNRILQVPDGLQGADAEAYADKRLVEMLPYAAAELEFQLRYGDDNQRGRAANEVMDRTGRSKKDGGGHVGPLMVINVGPDGMSLPWLKRTDKAPVVEAKTVDTVLAHQK